jgi:hypothetical protein
MAHGIHMGPFGATLPNRRSGCAHIYLDSTVLAMDCINRRRAHAMMGPRYTWIILAVLARPGIGRVWPPNRRALAALLPPLPPPDRARRASSGPLPVVPQSRLSTSLCSEAICAASFTHPATLSVPCTTTTHVFACTPATEDGTHGSL